MLNYPSSLKKITQTFGTLIPKPLLCSLDLSSENEHQKTENQSRQKCPASKRQNHQKRLYQNLLINTHWAVLPQDWLTVPTRLSPLQWVAVFPLPPLLASPLQRAVASPPPLSLPRSYSVQRFSRCPLSSRLRVALNKNTTTNP